MVMFASICIISFFLEPVDFDCDDLVLLIPLAFEAYGRTVVVLMPR